MKKSLIALALLFVAGALHEVEAQTPRQMYEGVSGSQEWEGFPVIEDLKLFEFEIGTGINFAPRWGEFRARPGANLNMELRLNRPEPWDFALQLRGANFTHEIGDNGNIGKIRTSIFSPGLFADYNHRFNRRTALFAGVGVGGMFAANETRVPINPGTGFVFQDGRNAVVVTPRVGVCVFNFLRITAEYSITARDYSRFGLNVGFTLGGSYKSPWVDRRSGKQKFWEDVAPAIINSVVP